VVGAYGAHELEKRHEKHQEKKRLSAGAGGRRSYDNDRDGGDRHHHRRRSSGGLLDGLKSKVEGFLDGGGKERDEGPRRSRSSVGGGRRGDYDRDGYDDYYEKRGGGRRRDDGY